MGSISPQCRDLELPHYMNFNFILSLLILVGILLSYLPQHIRIIRLRSSFGLSPYFVLLGTTSGTAAFANILVLPRSAHDAACCREISGVSCFAGLLGIFQVGVQCLSFYVILFLFLIYFPRATSLVDPTTSAESENERNGNGNADIEDTDDKQPSYATAVVVALICLVHAAIVLIISLVVALKYPDHLQAWANILGIMSAVLASIQYFPQIWTTFRLQKVGSLSIPMMCIQTPGSLVWAASLAQRLGAEGWSAWGVYVITALLQGTLLVMGVYFEYLGPKKDLIEHPFMADETQPAAEEVQDQQATEHTPLLSEQR
ncbi:PQ loop repeat protein [Talaromyces stipitatus ATCC 10500]|uniref:PQ loop repeat protein n=1 Tax=Talaromyces stipitatus (strain ATCC 10500 / CBS 375.48 / QM 6759 / NRRL 1006) TaxID=441959 RepID=B8M7N3_TALSN|nr:PQ loop repeat protein [Talaromyces stipitatus ATCC 10500]EED19586.1 PQ loop repeat protein [Talaromyces stipitatus ATCC 10500]